MFEEAEKNDKDEVGKKEAAGQRGMRTGPSAAAGMRRRQIEAQAEAETNRLIGLYMKVGESESDSD